jgi:hypothetical protein
MSARRFDEQVREQVRGYSDDVSRTRLNLQTLQLQNVNVFFCRITWPKQWRRSKQSSNIHNPIDNGL